ncbi:MAG TPA: ABC transporter permease [Anaerolineae bacterium]|nr:ABC transporter permease [Anaerolineae bacterium]
MRLNFSQNVRSALRGLVANKLRSALTMLGIVIGVGAVVALLSIGTGAQAAITGRIESIGSNLITVFAGSRNSFAPSGAGGGATAPLTYEEAQQLKGLPGVAAVSPQVQSRQPVKYQSKQTSVQIVGVTPDYAIAHPDQLDHGRFISTGDVSNRSRIVVVGAQIAADLFGGLDPVGKSIKINGILFRVVGVMKSQGSGGFGFSRDATTYIPITTAFARLSNQRVGNEKSVSTIEVSATNADSIDAAISAITDRLRTLHAIGLGEDADFTVQSQSDILSAATSITGTLTVFLGAIAGISLVVGGIGVMNIMLVSVTERTREIGLRKAVGARRSDILYQFLTETLTLSVLGGVIGILTGAGIAALVNASGLIATVVSIESVVLAFGFSAAVGIFFGIYPANRAAGLKPIEALRYE